MFVITKQEILNQLIREHEEGNCCCDLTEGGIGLCLPGAYVEGCVSLEDTLRDIEGDE